MRREGGRAEFLDSAHTTAEGPTLDSLSGVKYWVRNVSRHPDSFWLPTATDRFHPDFVALLNDGRYLVVEYKGAPTHVVLSYSCGSGPW